MPVTKTRKSAPNIGDYMDEEAPKRKRRYDEDDEDEETLDAAEEADDEDEDDEEEEDPDDLPARSSVVQKGWAAARKRIQEAAEAYTDDFKFTEDEQIVKFLTTEPLIYRQHWLENKPGKKSYVCIGHGCPLCDDLGDVPSNRFGFSVVNVSAPGMPVQILSVGTKVASQLSQKHESQRSGPLDKHFWALSRTGTGRSSVHSLSIVKERDLADDYDIDPEAVEAALAKRVPIKDDDMVQKLSIKQLEEVVDELS